LSRPKVHILFEHGGDNQPFGSAYIRLLRPLFYPKVQEHLKITAGTSFENREVDVVIIDRLWKPDFTQSEAEMLVNIIRKNGSKIIYSLDDNFLDMDEGIRDYFLSEEKLGIIKFLLQEADQILVPTNTLRDRLHSFNPNIVVIPHALDETLLNFSLAINNPAHPLQEYREDGETSGWERQRREWSKAVKIGYMGTFTHDDDFQMIFPALKTIGQRYKDVVTFEFLGVFRNQKCDEKFEGIPVSIIHPSAKQSIYPSFMRWFTSRFDWDIAISPLRESKFNNCKSDIKFLDYCAINAAGIYSNLPAYNSSVSHLRTGLLTNNDLDSWVEGLVEFIENSSLRSRVSRNATRYLLSNRLLSQRYQAWVNLIHDLLVM
jgi:glycosyltransferase involved in cell wall biosynthesis